MTDKNLFSAIGNIDEKYIEEAADEEKARPRLLLLRYTAAAAAFLIVISASLGIFMKPPAKFESAGLASNIGQTAETDQNKELQSADEEEAQNVGDASDFEGIENVDSTEQNNSSAPSDRPNDTKEEGNSAHASSTYSGGTKGSKYRMAQINFEDERFYRYLSDNDLSEFNLKPINNDSLGKKIGVVASKNCNLDFLIGCELFSYKEIDCDAIIILKNGDELVPFIFLGFRYHDRDFSEILSLYGVESSEDIEKITTRPGKPGMAKEKNITDSSEIKAVYDILLSIRNDKGKNDEIKKEYHYDEEKTYIYFKLHFKNGLTYQSFYRVYNGKSYIERHDFLTDEQTETLKNILLKQ